MTTKMSHSTFIIYEYIRLFKSKHQKAQSGVLENNLDSLFLFSDVMCGEAVIGVLIDRNTRNDQNIWICSLPLSPLAGPSSQDAVAISICDHKTMSVLLLINRVPSI